MQTGSTGSTGTANELKSELKDDGAKLADTAKQQATTIAQDNKGKATDTVKAAASAIDKAADDLQRNDDAPSWLSSAFKQAASSASDLASRVDDKEPRQIADEVSRFAKNSPTAFLAMSAMAGFAASRFLKAGAEHRDTGSSFTDGTGGTGGTGGTSGADSRFDKPYNVGTATGGTPGNTSTGTSSVATSTTGGTTL